MDRSLPGASVHGILQAKILEWVAIPFSKGSSQLRDQTQVSCSAGIFFTSWAIREAHRDLWEIFEGTPLLTWHTLIICTLTTRQSWIPRQLGTYSQLAPVLTIVMNRWTYRAELAHWKLIEVAFKPWLIYLVFKNQQRFFCHIILPNKREYRYSRNLFDASGMFSVVVQVSSFQYLICGTSFNGII